MVECFDSGLCYTLNGSFTHALYIMCWSLGKFSYANLPAVDTLIVQYQKSTFVNITKILIRKLTICWEFSVRTGILRKGSWISSWFQQVHWCFSLSDQVCFTCRRRAVCATPYVTWHAKHLFSRGVSDTRFLCGHGGEE